MRCHRGGGWLGRFWVTGSAPARGLQELLWPHTQSRTPSKGGPRLLPLHSHRNWAVLTSTPPSPLSPLPSQPQEGSHKLFPTQSRFPSGDYPWLCPSGSGQAGEGGREHSGREWEAGAGFVVVMGFPELPKPDPPRHEQHQLREIPVCCSSATPRVHPGKSPGSTGVDPGREEEEEEAVGSVALADDGIWGGTSFSLLSISLKILPLTCRAGSSFQLSNPVTKTGPFGSRPVTYRLGLLQANTETLLATREAFCTRSLLFTHEDPGEKLPLLFRALEMSLSCD